MTAPSVLNVAYASGDAGKVDENDAGALISDISFSITDADHPSVNSFDGASFTIRYASDSAPTDDFRIFTNDNGASWQLGLESGVSLNYEDFTDGRVALKVTVNDGGADGARQNDSNEIDVNININDVNDHDPQFVNPLWNGGSAGDDAFSRNFPENIGIDTNLATISATDADGTNNVVTYAITGGNPDIVGGGKLFFIDPNSGVITLKGALDFEILPNTYTLTITATDEAGGSNTQTLTINTLDVDDVVPVLSSTGSASVTAGESGVKTGLVLNVADSDSSSFRFDIDDVGNTDFASKFEIVANDNGAGWVLKLTENESLVYDKDSPSFSLKIRVWDDANNSDDEDGTDDDADSVITALVEVQRSEAGAAKIHFVDGNNDEITAPVVGNTLNLAVKTPDADGNGDFDLANAVWYRVTNAGRTEFSVTGNTYTATLADVGADILVEIEYTDANGNESVSSVRHEITDINDNAPVLSPALAVGTVDENAVGVVINGVILNISDADHPSVNSFDSGSFAITYAADGSDASGEFAIFTNDSGASWQLGLKSGVSLNYEDFTGGRVALKVTVNDGGADGARQNDSNEITINITIADIAEKPQLTAAVDAGTVAENAAAHTQVSDITLTLADGDRGTASSGHDFQPNDFTITDTNGVVDTRFAMVKEGADWKLVITEPFNFETLAIKTIGLLVTASNGRNEVSNEIELMVTVEDVNDAPMLTASDGAVSFDEQTFTEATDTGITFTINDEDAGDRFTADSFEVTGDLLDRFQVVDDNGVWKLQIKKDSVLDFEAQNNPDIELTITLSDGALTDSEDVTITIGNVDEGYRFEGEFTGAVTDDVDAAVPPISGTITRVINDDDPDAGNVAGVISVQNGETTTTKRGIYGDFTYTASNDPNQIGTWEYTLDRTRAETRALKAGEEAAETFTLVHENGAASQTITITITGDDNPFSFEQTSYAFTIDEGSGGRLVDTVSGSDPDADGASTTRYDFVNAPSDIPFMIHPTSGQIRVKNGVTLDYESDSSTYDLTIQATSNGKSVTAPVQITLTDLPDEALAFNAGHIYWGQPNGVVAENTFGFLAYLYADNLESGEYGFSNIQSSAVYSIRGVTADGVAISDHLFVIARYTPDGPTYLRLDTVLDYETAQTYRLTIRAEDVDFASVYDEHTLTITVTDENDAPVFVTAAEDASLNYGARVAETAAIGVEVARVRARDVDATGDTITYAIVSGNDDGHFKIDARTGIITLIKELNFDVETTYDLVISATDNGTPPLTTQARVVIHVDDVDLVPRLAAVNHKITGAVDENDATGADTGIAFTLEDDDLVSDFRVNRDVDGNFVSITYWGTKSPATVYARNFAIMGEYAHWFEIEADGGVWKLQLKDGVSFDHEEISSVNLQVTLANEASEAISGGIAIRVGHDSTSLAPQYYLGTHSGNAIDGAYALIADDGTSLESGVLLALQGGRVYDAGDFMIRGAQADKFEMVAVVREQVFVDPDQSQFVAQDIADSVLWKLQLIDGKSLDIGQSDTLDLNIEILPDADFDPQNVPEVIDVVVDVTDVDEALPTIPASYTFDVSEDAPIGTVLGTVRATDADDPNVSFSYTFGVPVGGQTLTLPGYGPFDIDYATGQITLNRAVDYDTAPADDDFMLYDAATKSYSITVQVSDNVNADIETTVTINILGVDDETPVLNILAGQSLTITENQVADVEIDFTASDTDTTLTAADFFIQDVVVAGRDSGIANKFEIVKNGANWRLKNKDGVVFDRDAYVEDSNGDVEFIIQVGVRDAGGNAILSEQITVTLQDAADSGNPPHITLIDFDTAVIGADESGKVTQIGFEVANGAGDSTDFDSTNFNIAGVEAQKFIVANVNGVWTLKLKSGETLDKTTKLRVWVTDDNGNSSDVQEAFIRVEKPPVEGVGSGAVAGIPTLAGATSGIDTLTGTADAEYIYGDAGDDTITSGGGADHIIGGAGDDGITLSSAAGSVETIYYRFSSTDGGAWTTTDGTDTITNFRRGEDKIVFLDADGSVIDLNTFIDHDNLAIRALRSGENVTGVEILFGTTKVLEIQYHSSDHVQVYKSNGGAWIHEATNRYLGAINAADVGDANPAGYNFGTRNVATTSLLVNYFNEDDTQDNLQIMDDDILPTAFIIGTATASVTEDVDVTINAWGHETLTAAGALGVGASVDVFLPYTALDRGDAGYNTAAIYVRGIRDDSGAVAKWNVEGLYGSLTLDTASGAWEYHVRNDDLDIQGLKSGDKITESFHYRLTGETTVKQIIIEIHGRDEDIYFTPTPNHIPSITLAEDNNIAITTRPHNLGLEIGVPDSVHRHLIKENSFYITGAGAEHFAVVNVNGRWVLQAKTGAAAGDYDLNIQVIGGDALLDEFAVDAVVDANGGASFTDTRGESSGIHAGIAGVTTGISFAVADADTNTAFTHDSFVITGANADKFEIQDIGGAWVLKLKSGMEIDAPIGTALQLQVQVSDGIALSAPVEVALHVAGAGFTQDEYTANFDYARLEDLSVRITGNQADKFELALLDGQWGVRLKAGEKVFAPLINGKRELALDVQITEGGTTKTIPIKIDVNAAHAADTQIYTPEYELGDAPEAGTLIETTIGVDRTVNTQIYRLNGYTYSAIIGEEGVVFYGYDVALYGTLPANNSQWTTTIPTIQGGGDADKFEIVQDAFGVWTLRAKTTTKFNKDTEYTINVQLSDGTDSFAVPITITGTEQNTFASDGVEYTWIGTAAEFFDAGVIETTAPASGGVAFKSSGARFTSFAIAGTDADKFEVVAGANNDWVLRVKAGGAGIRASIGDGAINRDLTITATDTNGVRVQFDVTFEGAAYSSISYQTLGVFGGTIVLGDVQITADGAVVSVAADANAIAITDNRFEANPYPQGGANQWLVTPKAGAFDLSDGTSERIDFTVKFGDAQVFFISVISGGTAPSYEVDASSLGDNALDVVNIDIGASTPAARGLAFDSEGVEFTADGFTIAGTDADKFEIVAGDNGDWVLRLNTGGTGIRAPLDGTVERDLVITATDTDGFKYQFNAEFEGRTPTDISYEVDIADKTGSGIFISQAYTRAEDGGKVILALVGGGVPASGFSIDDDRFEVVYHKFGFLSTTWLVRPKANAEFDLSDGETQSFDIAVTLTISSGLNAGQETLPITLTLTGGEATYTLEELSLSATKFDDSNGDTAGILIAEHDTLKIATTGSFASINANDFTIAGLSADKFHIAQAGDAWALQLRGGEKLGLDNAVLKISISKNSKTAEFIVVAQADGTFAPANQDFYHLPLSDLPVIDIAHTLAADVDFTGAIYEIIGGNEDGLFTIDRTSGHIALALVKGDDGSYGFAAEDALTRFYQEVFTLTIEAKIGFARYTSTH